MQIQSFRPAVFGLRLSQQRNKQAIAPSLYQVQDIVQLSSPQFRSSKQPKNPFSDDAESSKDKLTRYKQIIAAAQAKDNDNPFLPPAIKLQLLPMLKQQEKSPPIHSKTLRIHLPIPNLKNNSLNSRVQ